MEIWKSIEGYEGLYEVSNLGNVKSLERQVLGKLASYTRSVKERILKLKTSKYGYLEVSLHKEGKLSTKRVNRLVAIAFINNVNNYPQVNHIDGNKLNNHIDNLEWVTCKKNINHAVESGLTNQSNDKNNHSKLTKEDVIKIRQLISEGMMQKDVAKLYNMSTSGIYSIYHKITWKDV